MICEGCSRVDCPDCPHDVGPFDPDDLVRWAEMYGHPEGWAKRAQAAHARAEKLEAEIEQLRHAAAIGNYLAALIGHLKTPEVIAHGLPVCRICRAPLKPKPTVPQGTEPNA